MREVGYPSLDVHGLERRAMCPGLFPEPLSGLFVDRNERIMLQKHLLEIWHDIWREQPVPLHPLLESCSWIIDVELSIAGGSCSRDKWTVVVVKFTIESQHIGATSLQQWLIKIGTQGCECKSWVILLNVIPKRSCLWTIALQERFQWARNILKVLSSRAKNSISKMNNGRMWAPEWSSDVRNQNGSELEGLGFNLCVAPSRIVVSLILEDGDCVSAPCTYFHTMLPLEHGILYILMIVV